MDLPIPDGRDNNFWYVYNNSNTVVVFVHGIFSNSRTCWLHTGSGLSVFWPDLIRADPRFEAPSIYLGGVLHCRRRRQLPESIVRQRPAARRSSGPMSPAVRRYSTRSRSSSSATAPAASSSATCSAVKVRRFAAKVRPRAHRLAVSRIGVGQRRRDRSALLQPVAWQPTTMERRDHRRDPQPLQGS